MSFLSQNLHHFIHFITADFMTLSLYHNTNQRLRSAFTNQNSSFISQLFFHFSYSCLYIRIFLRFLRRGLPSNMIGTRLRLRRMAVYCCLSFACFSSKIFVSSAEPPGSYVFSRFSAGARGPCFMPPAPSRSFALSLVRRTN